MCLKAAPQTSSAWNFGPTCARSQNAQGEEYRDETLRCHTCVMARASRRRTTLAKPLLRVDY